MLWDARKQDSAADTTAGAPADAYFPAGQEVHVADEVAPVSFECFPAGQEVHSVAPKSDMYLPAGHFEQALFPPPFLPSELYLPGTH